MPAPIHEQDKLLTCSDCGVQFTFSARDQAFYLEHAYQAPRRCKTCRIQHKAAAPSKSDPYSGAASSFTRSGRGTHTHGHSNSHKGGPSENVQKQIPGGTHFKVTCSSCGLETSVPFKPNLNRPAYCRACYSQRRKSGQA